MSCFHSPPCSPSMLSHYVPVTPSATYEGSGQHFCDSSICRQKWYFLNSCSQIRHAVKTEKASLPPSPTPAMFPSPHPHPLCVTTHQAPCLQRRDHPQTPGLGAQLAVLTVFLPLDSFPFEANLSPRPPAKAEQCMLCFLSQEISFHRAHRNPSPSLTGMELTLPVLHHPA